MDDNEKTGASWRAWLQGNPEFLIAALILTLMGFISFLASSPICKA